MKTARTILPLLLLGVAMLFQSRPAQAQTAQDSVYVSVDPLAGNTAWHLSFNRAGQGLSGVTTILLTIDTTLYPNDRFDPNVTSTENPASSQYFWTTFGGLVHNDSVWWCNSSGVSIQRGQKDSFFVFGLTAPDGDPNSPLIEDSAVVIHWTALFQSNDCSKFSPISSGQFEVIPTAWQSYYPLDTVTATSTVLPAPDCDPSINLMVHNRNQLGDAIDHMVFQIYPNTPATMRPSEIKAPAGWSIQDVSEDAVDFTTSSNAINSGASLGGFVIGMSAQLSTTPYSIPFVWTAYNGSGILERDTTWDTAASLRVAPCVGSENPSPDTLSASNPRECNFNFNLFNFHSGQGVHSVSRVTALRLQITSPAGVTWNDATNPSLAWGFAGVGTPLLVFLSGDSANDGQPGGTSTAQDYGQGFLASISDPNPGENVTVHWTDSSGPNAISSGDVIIHCASGPPPTSDNVIVDKEGDCCYRVRLQDSHTPASNLHAVTLVMKPAGGSFDPASFSSNLNWATNTGIGNESVQFTAGGGTGLKTGATDTFYFCIDPATPGASWPLEVISKEAQTDNTITDTTISIPGCTPPLIPDSVIHHLDTATCSDLIRIVNQGTTPIDSIEVIPQTAGVMVAGATVAHPWSTPVISGDSAIITGSQISESTSLSFTANYAGETANVPFIVRVRTIHTPASISEVDSKLMCTESNAVLPPAAQTPVTLAVAPNPIRDETNISLTTGATGNVNMVLLNVLGQTAKVIERAVLPAGEHDYTLDASGLASGTYYLRLEADGQVITKKLVIAR